MSYFSAVELFGKELAREVYAILGRSEKVSFGLSGTEFNKTEWRIAGADRKNAPKVEQMRAMLDAAGLFKCRIAFFGQGRPDLRTSGDPEVHQKRAHALSAAGFSLLVIGDCLGYSTQSLRRWDVVSRVQTYLPRGTDKEMDDMRAAGRERVSEVRPRATLDPGDRHYLYVGAALKWLREPVG